MLKRDLKSSSLQIELLNNMKMELLDILNKKMDH